MAKFVLFCLNHSVNPVQLCDKPTRLGPGAAEAPYSRVEATADYHKGKIHIKNLGVTKCVINYDKVLRHGEEAVANPGDLIDLTFGTFVYQIRAWTGPLPVREHAPKEQIQNTSAAHKVEGKGVVIRNPVQPSQQISHTFSTEESEEAHGQESQQKSELNQSVLEEMMGKSDVGIVMSSTSAAPPSQSLEKKKILDSDWRLVEGTLGSMPVLVYGEGVLNTKNKVAGFDLDFTIIKPGPGLDSSDLNLTKEPLWEFLYPSTPKVLKDFFAAHSDHKFVIVTNKANAGWTLFSKRIIEEVVLELDIPVIVFAAKENTEFLKPAPFVWKLYNLFNEEVEPEWGSSSFCGDCGGRVKDLSKGDRLFALNLGMDFKSPEAFFLNKEDNPTLFQMPKFNPSQYVNSDLVAKNNDHVIFPHKLEIIIMCGIVGSGKSRYAAMSLEPKGYLLIKASPQYSTLKDRLQAVATSMQKKTSVVVDRRNVDMDERAGYVRLAQSHKVPIRCFLTNVTEEHARHNMRFQEIKTGKLLNSGEMEVCLRRHHALFEEPTTSREGFTEVVPINFIPQNFMSTEDLEVYSSFLIQR